VDDPARFTLIPANARRAYAQLIDKQAALQAYSEAHPVNTLAIVGQGQPGILVSGLAWNY
jgi:TPP-dependent indolepyruvate ferredoxin oxidoreductase alpha subunit